MPAMLVFGTITAVEQLDGSAIFSGREGAVGAGDGALAGKDIGGGLGAGIGSGIRGAGDRVEKNVKMAVTSPSTAITTAFTRITPRCILFGVRRSYHPHPTTNGGKWSQTRSNKL